MTPRVVIPARLESTRLAQKLLRLLGGEPMIRRTARAALGAGFPLWVAHDSAKIAQALEGLPLNCIQSLRSCTNGSERIAELVTRENWADDTIVVNVQGDEPLLPPQLIAQVAQTLEAAPWAEVATLACPLAPDAEHDPHAVKVVVDLNGRALYFSRAPLPFARVGAPQRWRHLGIYAYRARVLKRYPKLAPTPLEIAESLEQLRFLEHGLPLKVGTIAAAPPAGIDTEEDLRRAEAFLSRGTL